MRPVSASFPMLPLIDQILADRGCADLPAVRQAVEDACFNQTSFVDAVLDCEGVRERDFLTALAKTLGLPWWEPKDEDSRPSRGCAACCRRRSRCVIVCCRFSPRKLKE
jgi:hypothetical protein